VEYIFTTVFRTILLYAVIVLIFRLMGKREIGELSILDLVVFIMIGELAVLAIERPKIHIIEAILPMFLLMLIQIIMSIASLKSKRFRDLVDGKPSIIINRGKVDEEAMRRQRYNFDDLLTQLREKDIRSITDVEFAILESTGSLSVIEKKQKNNNKSNSKNQGDITIPLIMDGQVNEDHLKKINKTNLWLRQELKKRGYRDIKKISFCSYENGEFYIDLMDEE
jgi:uncharacterized membrane protein YcaP (DUF421 family)